LFEVIAIPTTTANPTRTEFAGRIIDRREEAELFLIV